MRATTLHIFEVSFLNKIMISKPVLSPWIFWESGKLSFNKEVKLKKKKCDLMISSLNYTNKNTYM